MNKHHVATQEKLIDLHEKWMKKGELHSCGLCWSIPTEYKETFELFKPEEHFDWHGWASDEFDKGNQDEVYQYGNIRQMIVLFICAIHNEL